jgi:hypothetical protein
MPISDWNRNTSLLALQLSVDYLLGVDEFELRREKRPSQRSTTSPLSFGAGNHLTRSAVTARGRKRVVRLARVHAGSI